LPTTAVKTSRSSRRTYRRRPRRRTRARCQLLPPTRSRETATPRSAASPSRPLRSHLKRSLQHGNDKKKNIYFPSSIIRSLLISDDELKLSKVRPPAELTLCTSGFWPRVRARALRAPVFLGSLTAKRGAARPPRTSQLPASYSSTKNKITYFQRKNASLQAQTWAARGVYLSTRLSCILLSYIAPY
jgi:hypothetical protein